MPPKKQQVAVVADSSVSLPPAMLKDLGIEVAPLEVRFGDRVYLDGTDIAPATFYRMLPTADPLPTTSAPRPGSFLAAFQRAGVLADQVVCVTLSAHLSAVHESALKAAEMARETIPGVAIHVVDSLTAASAEALVATAAAKAARNGESLEQVLEACQYVIDRVTLLAFLDTLHFVWKGGRIPHVAAWMGDVLNVKPMLEMKKGDIHLVARPRTRPRATERLLNIVAERSAGRSLVINVFHAADPEGAQQLQQRVDGTFHCQESFISEFTPAIGVHTGPGLLGLAFYALD